jgi:Rps23 Pro-64 3,4-dihydroxylase Tpa1-like proline 4-hydroxylase
MAQDRPAPAAKPSPLRAGIIVADNFLPAELAQAMRQDIEAHFASPSAHRADTHQVWNYWFVPELYTYLRTSPEKVIARERVDAFMRRLTGWCLTSLGMGVVAQPYLSLYVAGCRQGWHNDSGNGRFAFVYSLTRDDRRTTGGETLILREGDPFRANLTRATAGSGLYEAIEARFNRLVVFDDRLPHAVERVDGAMDPVEGRLVLHGHVSEGNIAVAGSLRPEQVAEPLVTALRAFSGEASARLALYHGPLALRISIRATGIVERCDALLDRVIHRDPGHADWEPLLAELIAGIGSVKFPPADGETIVIQPIVFGPPLRREP